jgi:hypothetical protein
MSNFLKNFLSKLYSWFLLALYVLRAGDNNRLVALLAIAGTSVAKAVVLNPSFAIDKHAHFAPLLFTHSRRARTILKKCGFKVSFSWIFSPVRHKKSRTNVTLALLM